MLRDTCNIVKIIACIFFFCSLSLVEVEDLSEYLQSTPFIDSDNPKIVAQAKKLTEGCTSEVEKARALFEFVRDSYTLQRCESFTASAILDCGGNLCHQRSILLSALCRAVGVPARLHLQKVTLKRGEKESAFAHSIVGIYLEGSWHFYETTGNSQKWIALTGDEKRASEMPIEFFADRDCLFPQDKTVITETLSVYFSDWTDEMIQLIRKIDGGNKYV